MEPPYMFGKILCNPAVRASSETQGFYEQGNGKETGSE